MKRHFEVLERMTDNAVAVISFHIKVGYNNFKARISINERSIHSPFSIALGKRTQHRLERNSNC